MAKIDLWGLQGEWFFEVGPELERWAIQAGYYKDDGSFPSVQNAVKYSDRPEKKAQIDAYTGAGMLVLGEIGGALLEGLPALSNTKLGKSVAKFFGKNVDDVAKGADDLKGGRIGGETHRETITTKADELVSDGWEITGGGGKVKEEYIPGPPKGTTKGSNYADITATKDGKTLRVQVGKQTKSGQPASRERANFVEIQKKKPNDLLEFLPYNK